MVGARCVSGESEKRGAWRLGGVWEARRWVSRTQFTQKHNPGPKTHKHRQSRNSNGSQKSALGPGKANARTASSASSLAIELIRTAGR